MSRPYRFFCVCLQHVRQNAAYGHACTLEAGEVVPQTSTTSKFLQNADYINTHDCQWFSFGTFNKISLAQIEQVVVSVAN